MTIDNLIPYADNFKQFQYHPSAIFHFHIRIDFDFAMSMPGIEDRVYYTKSKADNIRDRLNQRGIYLEITYQIASREIKCISVVFDSFCRVPYSEKADMEKIVEMLLAAKK